MDDLAADRNTMTDKKQIENFLSRYSEEVFNAALKLREIILKNLPSAQEQIDLPAKMIAYAYGQKYSEMVCTLIPSKKGLKLGFYKGNDLPDPKHLLKGSGKLSRYVEIRAQEDIKTDALTALLKEAFNAYKTRNNMTITPLFKKLNFKQHKEILILDCPPDLKAETTAMQDLTIIKTGINSISAIEFVLVFIKTQAEINAIAPLIDKKLKGDGIVWFAYPKQRSKKHKVEINRDNGWEILGKSGFEAVRQVAINENWSAVRFRKVAFIKTMKRKTGFAMTAEGRAKIRPAAKKK